MKRWSPAARIQQTDAITRTCPVLRTHHDAVGRQPLIKLEDVNVRGLAIFGATVGVGLPDDFAQLLGADARLTLHGLFEDVCAAFGFEKGQAQQHDDARAEIERVLNERLGQFIGRVGNDGFTAVGRFRFHEEVAPPEAIRRP